MPAEPDDCLLIVSIAARALAQSARRCGLRVHSLDLFADQDTRDVTEWSGKLAACRRGLDPVSVRRQLQQHQQQFGVMPVLAGSGMEALPSGMLAGLAETGWLGNDGQLVHRLKHPVELARVLHNLEIPHPPVRRCSPPRAGRWLLKQWAALGGQHVRRRSSRSRLLAGDYLQAYRQGLPVSALCLANGRQVRVIACQRALSSTAGNTDARAFVYSGLISSSCPLLMATFTEWAQRLVAAIPLKGLFGMDALHTPQGLVLIEINPRPPASFELYDDPENTLLHWHLSGLRGEHLSACQLSSQQTAAQQVFYPPGPVIIPANLHWPAAVRDRPAAGQKFQKHQPVCTIHVRGNNETDALQLLEEFNTELTLCLPVCRLT